MKHSTSLDQGVCVIVWSPLAYDLLSGKYRRDCQQVEGTRRLAGWCEPPIHDEERLCTIVDVLAGIAEGRQVSPAQVALA